MSAFERPLKQHLQDVHKSSRTNFHEIYRRYPGYIFKNSRRFLHDKPCDIKMQAKFVMPINDADPGHYSDHVYPMYSVLKIA